MKHCSASKDASREALRTFCALVRKWNRTVNLISRRDETEIWSRHIEDSLQLASLMTPTPTHAVDVGSGAGFPGLVLAIATGTFFDLVEADQRKAAFLREAARATGARVEVHAARAESVELKAPLVTARALAPLSKLLSLTTPLLAPGGMCLFLKGQNVDRELTDASQEWQMRVEKIPSCTAPDSCILRITEIKRVPQPT